MTANETSSGLHALENRRRNHIIAEAVIGAAVWNHAIGQEAPADDVLVRQSASAVRDVVRTGSDIDLDDAAPHVLDCLERMTRLVEVFDTNPPAVSDFLKDLSAEVAEWTEAPVDPYERVWTALLPVVRNLYEPSQILPTRVTWRAEWKYEHPREGLNDWDVSARTEVVDSTATVIVTFHRFISDRTLFSFPYVLAHELVAHCFARTNAPSEISQFSEGWMDCAAAEVVSRFVASEACSPSNRRGVIEDHCVARHLERYARPAEGEALVAVARRSQGRMAYDLARTSLNCRPSDVGLMRPDIVELSIALNRADTAQTTLDAFAARLSTWAKRSDLPLDVIAGVQSCLYRWQDRVIDTLELIDSIVSLDT